jgi:hypothetical protein
VPASGRQRVNRPVPVLARRAPKDRFRASAIRVRRDVRRRTGHHGAKGLRASAVRVVSMLSVVRAILRVAQVGVNALRVVLATARRVAMTAIVVRVVTPVSALNAHPAVSKAVRIGVSALRVLLATARHVVMTVSVVRVVTPVSALNAHPAVSKAVRIGVSALRVVLATARRVVMTASVVRVVTLATASNVRRRSANSASVPRAPASAPSVASALPAVSTTHCRPRHAVSATNARHEPTSRAARHTRPEPKAALPPTTKTPGHARRVAITKTHRACCVCRS